MDDDVDDALLEAPVLLHLGATRVLPVVLLRDAADAEAARLVRVAVVTGTTRCSDNAHRQCRENRDGSD